MSKNTKSNKFRKVNVDEFDEDKYTEEETDVSDEQGEGPNEGEVNSLLSQRKNAEALSLVLNSCPLGSKDQAVKDKAAQLVVRVLTSFKTSEVEPAVNKLDKKAIDILMKYIYRGFETPSEGSSAILLAWHEKTFAAGGLGSIVRVLTDRKRV